MRVYLKMIWNFMIIFKKGKRTRMCKIDLAGFGISLRENDPSITSPECVSSEPSQGALRKIFNKPFFVFFRIIFWWLWTRLRLWYIYRGATVPYSEAYADYKCPICHWDSISDDEPGNYLGRTDYYRHYDVGESWTSHFKCPRCGKKFSYEDGT